MDNFFTEHNIMIFLIQLLILLSISKVIGALCKKIGLSYIVGEILTGIILGPTIFARFLPSVYQLVFYKDPTQSFMLETTGLFGVLFLLLIVGFNIHLNSVAKQIGTSIKAGLAGSIIPLILAILVYYFLPASYWGNNATHITFVLFLAASSAINSLPVISKVLFDLGLIKSDLGLITLVSYTANEVILWLVFTISFAFSSVGDRSINSIIFLFVGLFIFSGLAFLYGSKIINFFMNRILVQNSSQTSSVLVFIALVGIFCGIITEFLGMGAIFGFFIAGIVIGNASEINEHWKEILSQVMNAIFVPLFFITIGLKLDFLANFDLFLVIIVIVTSITSKALGGYIGALWSGLPRADHFSMAIANIPGGTVEIILGSLAVRMGLITDTVFVAIVTGALISSIAVSPLMALTIRLRRTVSLDSLLRKSAILHHVKAKTIEDMIGVMAEKITFVNKHLSYEKLKKDVLERESLMNTALGKNVAVPHARIEEVFSPIIAYASIADGIDWDARDGLPVKHVFMIVLPKNERGEQVQILGAIARIILQENILNQILELNDSDKIYNILRASFKKQSQMKKKKRKN